MFCGKNRKKLFESWLIEMVSLANNWVLKGEVTGFSGQTT
jgi:hypothetical protein